MFKLSVSLEITVLSAYLSRREGRTRNFLPPESILRLPINNPYNPFPIHRWMVNFRLEIEED